MTDDTGDAQSLNDGGAAGNISDEQLVTAWGMVHEALNATDPLLLRGADPSGNDMPQPWFEVLIRLLRSPEQRLPMSRLAREVSLSSGGFTKLADRLASKGYLTRQACPDDRRVVYAALTPAGVELAEHARSRHVTLLRAHVVDVLGRDRLEQLADIARTLRDSSNQTRHPARAEQQ